MAGSLPYNEILPQLDFAITNPVRSPYLYSFLAELHVVKETDSFLFC